MGKSSSVWLSVSVFVGVSTDLSGGVKTDMSTVVSTDASGGASSDLGIACFMGTVFFFFIRFLLFNAGLCLGCLRPVGYARQDRSTRREWEAGSGFPAYNHKGKTDVDAGRVVYPSGHTHDE